MAGPDLADVADRLSRALARATGLLPDRQLGDMRNLVQAGEPGVALENFCTQLYEYDVSVPAELVAELETLAAAMGLRISPLPKLSGYRGTQTMDAEERVFGDMSEEFAFDDDSLDYFDAPLSGRLRRKNDGTWFAFDCEPVVQQLVWHWTLVPADRQADVRRVLEEAGKRKDSYWLSVIEDRRSSARSTCRCVRIENSRALPVLVLNG